jgi:hypothetical protein
VATAPAGRPEDGTARRPAPTPGPGLTVPQQGARGPSLAPLVPAPNAPAPPPGGAPAATATARPAPLHQRLQNAFDGLRSGEIETVMSLDGAAQSTSTLMFDLGDGSRPARMHISSIYTGPNGPRTVERIVVGDRAWERQGGGPWQPGRPQSSVWHQVHTLLPRSEPLSDAEVQGTADGTTLFWHEPGYDAEIALQVDAATAQPRGMQRQSRSTGGLLRVTYSGWNTPVDIVPPTDT